jgi:hypothetical protein
METVLAAASEKGGKQNEMFAQGVLTEYVEANLNAPASPPT